MFLNLFSSFHIVSLQFSPRNPEKFRCKNVHMYVPLLIVLSPQSQHLLDVWNFGISCTDVLIFLSSFFSPRPFYVTHGTTLTFCINEPVDFFFKIYYVTMQLSIRSGSQGREMVECLWRQRSVLQCQMKPRVGGEERWRKLLNMEKISSKETLKYIIYKERVQ